MDSAEFLRRIFDGYVTCYRKNNWSTYEREYANMTHKELSFFIQLGESLGFIVRLEMEWQYPRDLCWCEAPNGNEPFLYLERENRDGQAEYTIEKMLNIDNSRDIPTLVCVFGWIREQTLKKVKTLIRKRLPEDKNFLMISWIGDDKDEGPFTVEGWIFSGGKESYRKAKPEMDNGEYWYIYFEKDSTWTWNI